MKTKTALFALILASRLFQLSITASFITTLNETIDIDRPQKGMIGVSQQPLQDLL